MTGIGDDFAQFTQVNTHQQRLHRTNRRRPHRQDPQSHRSQTDGLDRPPCILATEAERCAGNLAAFNDLGDKAKVADIERIIAPA
eukprot:CAMPEP_0195254738 /NCGR_PEP_ID=MMETSP0706-20130129/5234_1 /TAXON_ID=33640 /ORGANISM="Asterionellopsis glacialis, Strain CCMP134" /LENGTH=84 /DNA_ID=CAMNT_0040307477 /DNA_START=582 /DNA_END=833 /DNA_ORIENTATION=+